MFNTVLRERSKRDVDRYVDEIMRKVKNEKERNLRCYHIATQYFKVGDYDSAKRYICMYLSSKEDSPMAHKLFGQILQGLGQKEKAVGEFKRSLELENNQPDIVLKICQLLSDDGVYCDVEKGRYWCERGEELFPHDAAVFRLKERLLKEQNRKSGSNNTKAFEDLIHSELRAMPNDVNARVRLLKLYTDSGRTQLAYDHVIEVENKQTFIHNLSWYEYLCEFFQKYHDEFTARTKTDSEFYINWVSALDRLVSLILAETTGIPPRTLVDCSKALFKFDQILHQAHTITSNASKLYESFLKHMSAQLCLHFATFILKRAKKDQNNWKESTKSVQPLLLLSLTGSFPNICGLNDSQKKLVKRWNDCASYRICQAGNVLLSLAKEHEQQFIEKIIHSCNANWREKLFQRLCQWDFMKAFSNSHFVHYNGYNTLPQHIVSARQLQSPEYIKACEKLHPGSLHHITWIGLQTMRHSSPRPPHALPPPEFHTYGFPDLQYTVHNLSMANVETLNRLDLDAFLYATVLCAGAELDEQIRNKFYATDRPITLPADITVQLCSPEQAKWWDAAYKVYVKCQSGNWADLRLTLYRGIEVIRAIGNHGLHVLLMVQLARTFSERAISCSNAGKGSSSFQEVSALEARANVYWKAALPLLERMERKQAIRPSSNQLFEYHGKELEPSQITTLLEEGRLFTASQLMKDEEYEAAIEAFKPLRSPYASFHSSVIYKKLAQAEINNCPATEVTSEMRSKYVILLTKARESIHQTRDRIQNDRNHPLHHVIGTHIGEIESLLSRIELDGAGVTTDDRNEGNVSEGSYSPPGSIISRGESAGGDYVELYNFHRDFNGQHSEPPSNVISSTPKVRHSRNVSNHSHQQKSGLDQKVLDDVEKMLATHKSTLLNTIEVMLLDHQKKIEKHVEDVSNKGTAQIELAIDELRHDMNKLRTDDLYMLGDDDDYTEDVLGFPSAYQTPLTPQQTAQPPLVPQQQPAHVAPASFYPPTASVVRGAQGTSTVTYGTPPQPQPAQYFTPQFQPSPQPPALHAHQLGFYGQSALPFSEGQQLPDFLRAGLGTAKLAPVNVVITTSDTLPTGPPPVQPPLSVTIPPKHRLGTVQFHQQPPQPHPVIVNAPHDFQISMPASANLQNLQKSPIAAAAIQDDLESDEGENEVEHDPFPDFKPIIPLPDEVVVTTGEEDSKVLFKCRSKLFRFVDREWKERGIGILKILQDSGTNKVRLVMRREQVHKICANHYLTPDMILTPMVKSDRAWVWLANDFADETLQVEKLCAKFKTPDEAAQFKEAFDSAKVIMTEQQSVGHSEKSTSSTQNEKSSSKIEGSGFTFTYQKDKQTPGQIESSSGFTFSSQTETKPAEKIVVGGFTFTMPPLIKPQEHKEEEWIQDKNENSNKLTEAPSPFASFNFVTPQQRSMFSSAPAPNSGSSTFQMPPTMFTSVPPQTMLGSFSVPSPSNFGAVLKPPVLTPPSAMAAPGTPGLVQSPGSVFSTPFVTANVQADKNLPENTSKTGILSTPIFTTPTGPNLILNQNLNTPVFGTVPSLTPQPKQVLFKETSPTQKPSDSAATIEPVPSFTSQPKQVLFKETSPTSQKPIDSTVTKQSQNISPKSILKETGITEPLSTQKQNSKHVLFQDAPKNITDETQESTSDEKIVLRRPRIPIDKLLSSPQSNDSSNSNSPASATTGSLFDKPGLLDFSALNKNNTDGKPVFQTSDDFKGFAGAGSKVFKTAAQQEEDNEENPEESGDEGCDFKPVIPLPELIKVETGEEGETLLYEQRAKLLRFDSETKQWKERGIGNMKILHDSKSGAVRLLMRREQVLKVCCNHRITSNFELKTSNSDKAWTWSAQDYSEGVCTNEFFALRFKTTDQAMEFKDAIENAKQILANNKVNTSLFSNISSEGMDNLESSVISNRTSTDTSNMSSTSVGSTSGGDDDDDDDETNNGVWKCKDCLFPNSIGIDSVCRSCETNRKGVIPLSQLSMFKRNEGSWECSFCFVMNDVKSEECVACCSPKSTIIKEIKSAPATNQGIKSTPPTTNASQPSLSDLFKPKVGSWECSGCLVRNDGDVKQCPACGTMKPGETSAPEAVTSTTGTSLFGNSILGGNTDFSKTGFSFGIPKQPTTPTSGATFSFGIPTTQSSTAPSAFTFGVSASVTAPTNTNENSLLFASPVLVTSTSTAATPSMKFSFGGATNKAETTTDNLLTGKPIFGSVNDNTITPSATFTFGANNMTTPATTFVFKGPSTESEENKKFEFNFSGVRSPKSKSPAHPDTDGDSEGETNDNEEECDNIFFQPVIPLPDKVPLTTGEESEEVLYSHRAKLFRFVDSEWKERGIGDVKILRHRENKKVRLLMRRETILKLCLNHFLTPELEFRAKDDKTWMWGAMDYSEGEISQEKFAIRFKTPDIAQDFKAAIDSAQVDISDDTSGNQSFETSGFVTPAKNESPAMKEFKFVLPTASSAATPTSPSSNFSLANQFGNSSGFSTAQSLFGGSSPMTQTSDDVQVVYEKTVTDDLKEKARQLQLPPNFYSYLNASPCPGCPGCDPDDDDPSPSKAIHSTPPVVQPPSFSSNIVTADNKPTTSPFSTINLETKEKVFGSAADKPEQPEEDKCSFLFKQSISFADLASKPTENIGFKPASTNFQWSGADSTVFGKYVKPGGTTTLKKSTAEGDSSGGEDDEGEVAPNQNDPHFEPIVPLPPLVQLSTGEEEETKVFCQRAKLYQHHAETKEWKERGVGEMKILYHPVKLTYRLLMRREQVHKVVCNHLIGPELTLAPMATSQQAWCWTAMNLTEDSAEPQLERLAIRFKTVDLANQFKEKIAECIEHVRQIKETQSKELAAQLCPQQPQGGEDSKNEEDEEGEVGDDDEEEEEDDDDDDDDDLTDDIDEEDEGSDWEIMFDKKVTLCVRNTKQSHWSSVGPAKINVVYSNLSCHGQIRIIDDKNHLVISCTTIDSDINIEVQGKAAVWTAMDTALEPPSARQLMAKFSTEEDVHSFDETFKEAVIFTKRGDYGDDEIYE